MFKFGMPSLIVERSRSMLSSDDVAIWMCFQLMVCVDCKEEMRDSRSWFSI